MLICDRCGKEFDEDFAESDFMDGADSSVSSKDYDNIPECLCGECAIEYYNNGEYRETCESCGKVFEPENENSQFELQISNWLTGADMYEFGIYCAECAERAWREEYPPNDEEELEEGAISVYDAALIWASKGKDEDYTFGYSEEELEEALY